MQPAFTTLIVLFFISLSGYLFCAGLAERFWNAPLFIICLSSVVHAVIASFFTFEVKRKQRAKGRNDLGVKSTRSLEFLRISTVVVGAINFGLSVLLVVENVKEMWGWHDRWERKGVELMEKCVLVNGVGKLFESALECPFDVGTAQSMALIKFHIWEASATLLGIHGIMILLLLISSVYHGALLNQRQKRGVKGCVTFPMQYIVSSPSCSIISDATNNDTSSFRY